MKTRKEIQQEFETLLDGFAEEKAAILENESLHTLLAKHPLYEIEPFFSEHNNEFLDEDSPSFLIDTAEDYDPERDQLYKFRIDMNTRKALFRTEIFGGGTSYDTIYSYTENYYRSATVYINPEMQKAIKLCYLFFEDGMPHTYVECSEYGALSKTYRSEDGRLLGYLQDHEGLDNKYEVAFTYNFDGALDTIIGREAGKKKENLIFKRPDKNQNIADTLETIENHLVEEIANQIGAKVKIEEEVFCILLEYTMQGAFPPTIGIGVLSDVAGDINHVNLVDYYNAPDMQYFSESGTLEIDLFTPVLEEAYLFYDRTFDFHQSSESDYSKWSDTVRELYLRVCKRLMHIDFSNSFSKTDNFLVLARDFEACNEEEYYQEMLAYAGSRK